MITLQIILGIIFFLVLILLDRQVKPTVLIVSLRVGGYGGLSDPFLAEEHYYGDDNWMNGHWWVEATKPITADSGQVRLPSGYLLSVTRQDIEHWGRRES
jgi:hypothetical protein